MEALALYGSLSDTALLLGLSVTRIAVAFLLVPLFTADLIPSMVRNAMFLAMAVLSLALQPSAPPLVPSGWLLASLFARELFIGAAIGFFFSGAMWAFQAAGQLIDNRVGTSQAQVSDPSTGQQVTLNGALFGRLASWIFMAGGGFMLMTGTLFESYTWWPVRGEAPSLVEGGMRLFEGEFGRIMLLTLLVAGPALVLLYVIEGVLGLINRFAQQLNVFSLALSLKAVAATWIIWIQVVTLVQLMQDDLFARAGTIAPLLRALLRS